VLVIALAGCGGSDHTSASASRTTTPIASTTASGTSATVTSSTASSASAATAASKPPPPPKPPFAVGERVVTFVDSSRLVRIPGQGTGPRKLVTIVRYPAEGAARRTDVIDATPQRATGPFPLLVFGHGFAVTPHPYAALLQAWARAGYVVAAPIFPLENGDAPGGPNESDLVNQPRDMSVVISRMLAASSVRRGFFSGLVDRHRIAVSGQSDGGETALAVAYDRQFIDRRVRAAAILSGAKIPGVGGFDFPAPSPPLLATQGTADTINPPSFTSAFFDIAPPPKYLLTMFGAPHLGPYTDQQPQLRVVERVTIAFFDHYLKGLRGALGRITRVGDLPGISHLSVFG
jgi:dienelactone hydrolase